MRPLLMYVDASVVGGCEDEEFVEDSRALWRRFVDGRDHMALSTLTLAELEGAPEAVRQRIRNVPSSHVVLLEDSPDADDLAAAYLAHGVVGSGSHADALHVAMASVGRVDVVVSWNFKHIVNLRRIRLFQAVNLEHGYGMIEIRSPKEVLGDDTEDV